MTPLSDSSTGPMPSFRWRPGDWSWVVFSGATTGMPKGIMLPHGFALAHARRVLEAIRLNENDKWFSSLQMCHAWLNFVVLASCLVAGAHCATTRWFSASRWLSLVRAFGATVVDPYLPMASALVAQQPTPQDKDHSIRACPSAIGSAAELDRRLAFEQRFGIRTINCFGLTEAGGLAAAENLDLRRDGATGKPTADFNIIIADEDGNELPAGEIGEILYRPTRANVAAIGYLNDHERTVKSWRNLWIHSGDLGYFDEDGFLYFGGRQPHWLRRKGENLSAREVEEAIRAIDGVADAAVVGIASKLGDDDIRAFVVLKSDAVLAPIELHTQLIQQIAFFKVPRFFEVVEDFARTMKGEPDRKALQALPLSGREWDAEIHVLREGRRN